MQQGAQCLGGFIESGPPLLIVQAHYFVLAILGARAYASDYASTSEHVQSGQVFGAWYNASLHNQHYGGHETQATGGGGDGG